MSNTPTHRWEKAATIATWVQTVAVVASLIFIGSQLNQQIKLSRASNAQAFVALSQPLNLRMTEPEMAKLWLKREQAAANKAGVSADAVEDSQFDWMLSNWLVFYENVYVQYQQGLVDEALYRLWDIDLEYFVLKEPIEKFWANSKDAYQTKFREHVDQLLDKKSKAASGH